jgi:YD repeat-containing protein
MRAAKALILRFRLNLGQLIREDNMAKGASYRYYYDLAGNITKRETYEFSITGLGDVKKTETLRPINMEKEL